MGRQCGFTESDTRSVVSEMLVPHSWAVPRQAERVDRNCNPLRLVENSGCFTRLADLRYQGGVTSYLEVLDADTRLFIAELGMAEAERSELTGLVEIYRALGGGWQQ